MGTDFDFDFFAVNSKSFNLKVRLPHLFSVALGEADIMAVLFAFFIEV